MPFPPYPNILLPADWDKKKGALAKTAGETGVGAAMANVIKTRDAIDLTKLVVSSTYPTLEAVDAALKEFKENFSKLEPVRLAAYKLRDLAKGAASKFQSKPLIPKASSAHALAVADAADKYGMALKQYNPTKEFEDARKRVQLKLDTGLKSAKSYGAKLEAGLKTIKGKSAPTGAEWLKFWSENLRGLNAAIAVIPSLKDHLAVWRVLCSQTFLGDHGKMTSEEIKKKIAQVEVAWGKLKPALG